MNNPSTLKRAQDELDIKVGKHRKVNESDIKNLVYLQAIIKETLRLYPAAKLSVPREAMEDCNVAGFHIQAGTRLLVNLWKLPRDSEIWPDPLEFQPGGFLTKQWILRSSLNAKGNKKKGKRPPEPSGQWPLIGHLHLLGADKLLHRTLGDMADNWEVAKKCYTTSDKVFATRPKSLAIKLMGYDHGSFVFAPYGPYWCDVRKLAMVELLSNRQLEMHKHVQDSEVKILIKEFYGQWASNKDGPALVEMKERFGNLSLNVVMTENSGKRYFGTHACGDEPKRGKKAFDDFMILVGLFMVSDAIPFLGWLDTVKMFTAQMKRVAEEVDYVLGSWVEEHRQNRLSANDNGAEQDFIHAMLSVIDDGQFSGRDPDTIIKGTCSSTSYVDCRTLYELAMTQQLSLLHGPSLLLNNRHVLKKAQADLMTTWLMMV
ncbi:cytochrome P450 CYP82H23-like [Vitis riparia]|uniref:cytochrome P450 CYP82H23-like n=1 Tax=Vitis riparia TaxID=96939 RepID=UPI00155A4E14|nr:cytochrome P450 CYP82H23-like [Vitis riparia]